MRSRILTMVLTAILGLAALSPAGTQTTQASLHRSLASVPVDFGDHDWMRQAIAAGRVRPLSLASADFDEDGVADLASGYGDSGRGLVALHRGDSGARGEAPPFRAAVAVFDLPGMPDFLGAGDFDNDGHADLLAASLGSRTVCLLPGDGHGGFHQPASRSLDGKLLPGRTGQGRRVVRAAAHDSG